MELTQIPEPKSGCLETVAVDERRRFYRGIRSGTRLLTSAPTRVGIRFLGIVVAVAAVRSAMGADPLPSWNDTAPRKAIIAFVERVTREGSPDFVPVPERIATFDNDGTLWAEQPMYFQLAFALDRVKALAPQHPEWKTQEPFASVLRGDAKGVTAGGEKGAMELVTATH